MNSNGTLTIANAICDSVFISVRLASISGFIKAERQKLTKEQPYAQEGYDLMGAAFEVHRETGGGLAEEIYQECLELEPEFREITFIPRQELLVFYKGKQLRKRYIPDLVVFDGIVVELKSVKALLSEHEAQLINYMRTIRNTLGNLRNIVPT